MKPSHINGCSDFVIFDNVGHYGRVNKKWTFFKIQKNITHLKLSDTNGCSGFTIFDRIAYYGRVI